MGSATHCNGWPFWRAASSTCSTLVWATSLVKTPHTPLPSRWILSMICVAASRSLLKNSWSTITTNSMGVKSSLSMTTWYICGGCTRWARRSSTTASPPSVVFVKSGGSVGGTDFFVAIRDSFYRCFLGLAVGAVEPVPDSRHGESPDIDKSDNHTSNWCVQDETETTMPSGTV